MIKIENTNVFGFETAIRGMRNPMNSWNKSDSKYAYNCLCDTEIHECDPTCSYDQCIKSEPIYKIGPNDLTLMKKLVFAGTDHSKFMRMINVTMDITAPLYWYKEFDTYKVGTVANSCSTMHKIQEKEFTIDDFSHEHLWDTTLMHLKQTIELLNIARDSFNHHGATGTYKKDCWWQMIQLLPSSYNQKRTIQLNYAVLANMYHSRKNHKLDEWHEFCRWIETLPYSELITKNFIVEDNVNENK